MCVELPVTCSRDTCAISITITRTMHLRLFLLGLLVLLSALSKHAVFGVAQQGELARLCKFDGWRPAKKLEENLAKQLAKKLANKLA